MSEHDQMKTARAGKRADTGLTIGEIRQQKQATKVRYQSWEMRYLT